MEVNLVWSAICFKIMTRYTCVFLPRILAFFPAFGSFYSQVYGQFLTNAYIYAHKKAHTYALQTSMWYTGSQKVVVYIRGTELYRQQKTPSCTRFGSYSYCPHSSGGCWLPDNGFVGIRGLSLERLCTLFHKC